MNVFYSLRPPLLAAFLLAPLLHAQQKTASPEQTPASTAPTLSVDARLVNLPVVVRDKKDRITYDSLRVHAKRRYDLAGIMAYWRARMHRELMNALGG